MEVGFQRGAATGGKCDVAQTQEWRSSHAIGERAQPAESLVTSIGYAARAARWVQSQTAEGDAPTCSAISLSVKA